MTFFEWVAECCRLLGQPLSFGENLLPEKDPSWYFCYDDGMTPDEAVSEFRELRPNDVPEPLPG